MSSAVNRRLRMRLGGISAGNMFAGFLIQWYIVWRVGAGNVTDAFFAGNTLQQIVLGISTGTMLHVLVPLFVGKTQRELENDAWSVLAVVALAGTAVTAVLFVTAPAWVRWAFPGFPEDVSRLTVHVTRIQLPAAVLTMLMTIQWAVWRAKERALGPELSALTANAITLVLLVYLLPRFGVLGAAWVMVFRILIQVLLLSPGLGRFRAPSLDAPIFRVALHRVKPLLVGTAYYKLEPAVDRFLSSMAGAGALSTLYLAQLVYSAASQVLNVAVVVPAIPVLTRFAQRRQWHEFQQTYRQGLLVMIAISVSACGIILSVGRPIAQAASAYGHLDGAKLHLLWTLLVCLAGVLIGGASGQILTSAFYAEGDTRTPTVIGIVGFTVGAALKVIGFLWFGLIGLAVATSAYYLGNAFAEYVWLERVHKGRAE